MPLKWICIAAIGAAVLVPTELRLLSSAQAASDCVSSMPSSLSSEYSSARKKRYRSATRRVVKRPRGTFALAGTGPVERKRAIHADRPPGPVRTIRKARELARDQGPSRRYNCFQLDFGNCLRGLA